MAIVGGAIMPLIQGRLLDATSPAISFVVPAISFAVVTSFAVFDLRAAPHTAGERE
jgi:FHS family L-fucose permease-like MFS transporter